MTECARCGDCCDPVEFRTNWTNLTAWVEWARDWREYAWENLRDGEDCGMDENELRQVADSEFITTHWTPAVTFSDALPEYQCSAWDRETRLCTAHATRPPICRGFPWYGQEPDGARLRRTLRCSFWADVKWEQRPGANQRALPILRAA